MDNNKEKIWRAQVQRIITKCETGVLNMGCTPFLYLYHEKMSTIHPFYVVIY